MFKSLKLCSPLDLCFVQLEVLGDKTHMLMLKGIHQLEAASHHPAGAERGHLSLHAVFPTPCCGHLVLCLRETRGFVECRNAGPEQLSVRRSKTPPLRSAGSSCFLGQHFSKAVLSQTEAGKGWAGCRGSYLPSSVSGAQALPRRLRASLPSLTALGPPPPQRLLAYHRLQVTAEWLRCSGAYASHTVDMGLLKMVFKILF